MSVAAPLTPGPPAAWNTGGRSGIQRHQQSTRTPHRDGQHARQLAPVWVNAPRGTRGRAWRLGNLAGVWNWTATGQAAAGAKRVTQGRARTWEDESCFRESPKARDVALAGKSAVHVARASLLSWALENWGACSRIRVLQGPLSAETSTLRGSRGTLRCRGTWASEGLARHRVWRCAMLGDVAGRAQRRPPS
jgi:hypothetical protein